MRYALIAVTVFFFIVGGYLLLQSHGMGDHARLAAAETPACQEDVIVYSSPYCGYCTAAKKLLDDLHMPYTVIDVHDDQAKRAELIKKTSRKTVPQIFINGQHVGGFDDLNALYESGKLTKFRKSCNIDDLK